MKILCRTKTVRFSRWILIDFGRPCNNDNRFQIRSIDRWVARPVQGSRRMKQERSKEITSKQGKIKTRTLLGGRRIAEEITVSINEDYWWEKRPMAKRTSEDRRHTRAVRLGPTAVCQAPPWQPTGHSPPRPPLSTARKHGRQGRQLRHVKYPSWPGRRYLARRVRTTLNHPVTAVRFGRRNCAEKRNEIGRSFPLLLPCVAENKRKKRYENVQKKKKTDFIGSPKHAHGFDKNALKFLVH